METLTLINLSNPHDYSQAMALGVGKLLKKACVSPVAVRNVLHCTTVVTNICIELIAAMVGRIATKGFWDILEISHGRMPRLYDLTCSRPLPMVQLYLRREVDEQMDKYGRVIKSLYLGEMSRVDSNLIAGLDSNAKETVRICAVAKKRRE